jgi:alpha-beta hydrolase superfamily lysophospholipase
MRRSIWKDLLDADLNARYWGEKSRISFCKDRWIRIFLAATSSGSIAGWAFWESYPLIWKFLSGISALLAVSSPILDIQGQAKCSLLLYTTWIEIVREYDILWLKIENGNLNDSEKIISIYQKIRDKEIQCGKQDARYTVDRKLLEKLSSGCN